MHHQRDAVTGVLAIPVFVPCIIFMCAVHAVYNKNYKTIQYNNTNVFVSCLGINWKHLHEIGKSALLFGADEKRPQHAKKSKQWAFSVWNRNSARALDYFIYAWKISRTASCMVFINSSVRLVCWRSVFSSSSPPTMAQPFWF